MVREETISSRIGRRIIIVMRMIEILTAKQHIGGERNRCQKTHRQKRPPDGASLFGLKMIGHQQANSRTQSHASTGNQGQFGQADVSRDHDGLLVNYIWKLYCAISRMGNGNFAEVFLMMRPVCHMGRVSVLGSQP